jgi:hypothetical protein
MKNYPDTTILHTVASIMSENFMEDPMNNKLLQGIAHPGKRMASHAMLLLWDKRIALFILTIFLSLQGYADIRKDVEYHRFPLKSFIGNHVSGLPFQNLMTGPKPSFFIGTELNYNRNPKHQIGQTLHTGFFFNEVLGNGVPLYSDFFYRHARKKGFIAEAGLGLGGMIQFRPRDMFQFKSSSGEWEKVGDAGKLSQMMGVYLGMGYDFSHITKYTVSISAKHRFFVQAPYFDYQSFPIMPQSFSGIEITYKIRKK